MGSMTLLLAALRKIGGLFLIEEEEMAEEEKSVEVEDSAGAEFKLRRKQQRFIDEYLIDLNGTQAAIRAGYSERSAKDIAAENLAKPAVRDALARRMAEIEERTLITQDRIMLDIEAVKQDAMRESSDALGNKAMVNHMAALKAAELQGKHIGMFVQKVELTGKDGGAVQVETIDPTKLSTAALAEILAAKDAANPR